MISLKPHYRQSITLNDVCRSIVEHNELKSIRWTAGAVSFVFQAFPFFGFSLAMFMFYSFVPVLFKFVFFVGDEWFHNAQPLFADLRHVVDWMYYLVFVAVAVGLIVDSSDCGVTEQVEEKTESGVERNSMSTGIGKLRYHHGGKLLRTPVVRYVNGSEVEYDEDIDRICYWTILGTIKFLGHDIRMSVKVYYLEEGKSLDGGLKLISDDKGVLEMASQLKRTKLVDIYVEHLEEKVSEIELPDALRQSMEGDEEFVDLVDDSCQLPPTPHTPRFDDLDTDLKRDEHENESDPSEDLQYKEFLTDLSMRQRFEHMSVNNDKAFLSLQEHPSFETQKTKTIEEGIDAELILSDGRDVEVTFDEEGYRGAWYACTILKVPKNKTEGKVLVKYKNLLENDNETPLTESVEISFIRPLPPKADIPGDQCFQVKEDVDAFHLDGWWTGSVSEVLDSPKRYIVSFADPPEEVEFSSSNLRPPWKWVNGKWVKPSKFQEGSSSDCQELAGLSCDTAKDAKTCPSMTSKEPEKNTKLKRTTPEGDATSVQPSKRFKHVGVGSCKKYGRRLKFHVEGSKHQDAEKIDNSKVAATTEVSEVQKVTKEFESSVTKGLSVECMSGSVTEEYSHVPKEGMYLHKEHGMGRRKKRDGLLEIKQPKSVLWTSQSPSVGIADAAGVLVPEEYKATEVEPSAISGLKRAERTNSQRKIINAAEDSGGILHENEEQSQSICDKNDSGDCFPGSATQSNDPREKPFELMVQSPLVGLTSDNELESRDLPFVKSIPIWKEIESMEIFKILPQTPHFHPLVRSKEFLREGSAVGYMVSFASLMEKASKLSVADPRDLFTNILDAVPEFESLGFDVNAVKYRTSELLSMNDRHRYLQHHSKEVELQVKQCSDEVTKINEEIDANYKMVRELEEKQALLLSSKESKIYQLNSLQVCADVSARDLLNVEADFESLVPRNWSCQ